MKKKDIISGFRRLIFQELLLGTHINYFHCLKIVDILKETEADSKNFFGQYGSKRMIDWKKIIR